MEPTLPFWFKQRQCKAEPAGEHALRIAGPNLPEAFLRVEPAAAGWRAAVRLTADGEDVSSSDGNPTADAAWQAAFELYRLRFIV
ncbi:MAG TPA: hypothetical protein VMS17_05085 [Gemmataceae bacterium]|nr:hypothetical protein [Gemmataceae bacterium]